jgi:hypothetical protein
MEGNGIPKTVLYLNLETISPTGRPRNKWQDEVREDRRIAGGDRGKERYITERMEEASGNGKESSHSAHLNGMNEFIVYVIQLC